MCLVEYFRSSRQGLRTLTFRTNVGYGLFPYAICSHRTYRLFNNKVRNVGVPLRHSFRISLRRTDVIRAQALMDANRLSMSFIRDRANRAFSGNPLIAQVGIFCVLRRVEGVSRNDVLCLSWRRFLLLTRRDQNIILHSMHVEYGLRMVRQRIPFRAFSPHLRRLKCRANVQEYVFIVTFSLVPSTSNGLVERRQVGRLVVRCAQLGQPPKVIFWFVLQGCLVFFRSFNQYPRFDQYASPNKCWGSCKRFRVFDRMTNGRMDDNANLTRAFKDDRLPLYTTINLEYVNSLLKVVRSAREQTDNLFRLLLTVRSSRVNQPFRIQLSTTRPSFARRRVQRFPTIISTFRFGYVQASNASNQRLYLPTSLVVSRHARNIAQVPFKRGRRNFEQVSPSPCNCLAILLWRRSVERGQQGLGLYLRLRSRDRNRRSWGGVHYIFRYSVCSYRGSYGRE